MVSPTRFLNSSLVTGCPYFYTTLYLFIDFFSHTQITCRQKKIIGWVAVQTVASKEEDSCIQKKSEGLNCAQLVLHCASGAICRSAFVCLPGVPRSVNAECDMQIVRPNSMLNVLCVCRWTLRSCPVAENIYFLCIYFTE